MGDAVFDLFGDPVPEGRGRPGRPSHVATMENRNKVKMLLALGWETERVSRALGVSVPTLRKHYLRELRIRDDARARLDARLAMLLWEQCGAGNVAAMKEFRRMLEQSDVESADRQMIGGRPLAAEPRTPAGKKVQAATDAQSVLEDGDWSTVLPQLDGAPTLQ